MVDDRPQLPGGLSERTVADSSHGPMTHVFGAVAPAVEDSGPHPLVRPAFDPPRRPLVTLIRRTGWLVVLVVTATVGVLAVASSGAQLVGDDLSAEVARIEAATIALPATTATIGLDTDSREVVLNLCWRVSDNANLECRLSFLEAEGELPPRDVDVPAFSIDRLEVSNAEYAACADAGGCVPRSWEDCRVYTQRGLQFGAGTPETIERPEHPAVCVNYEEAAAYCAWRDGRLPTAVEWERAARAGETRLQPWGGFWSPALANWGERDMGGFPIAGRLDGFELTAPVDALSDGRSPDGIAQLLGNAAEWVVADDEERSDGKAGVRGGSYRDPIDMLRATYHRSVAADARRTTIGFRCAYN